MKIVNLTKAIEPYYFVCLEDWNEDLYGVKSVKEKWFRQMKKKGLRVKIALNDENQHAGMIEYMPIEHSYTEGKDLYIVNCIWVHGYNKGLQNQQGKGIGKALLKTAEEDVKSIGKHGLAVWGLSEPYWMNALWFQKQGYKQVDQYDWFVLLWKQFNDKAIPPKWTRGTFKQKLVPGKVKVTAFYSGQCCSENTIYFTAKKAACGFGDKVIFEVIDMNQKENRDKYGMDWRLVVNGENLFHRHIPTYEEIKSKIAEKLKEA